MKININDGPIFTEEGARAKRINPELELRRSVMACMLWEKNFYEDGESIANRIKGLIPKVKADSVAQMAIEARENMRLRHVPLLIIREMARLGIEYRCLVSKTLERVIQRADEISEFMAIYWKDGKEPISKQVKIGLAKSFQKFNEYQLAKYNSKDAKIKLRDVLFMVHAKPKDKAQEKLWKRLANNDLKTPDTWEVSLSAGKDKKETWERLLKDEKLGALAFLRNLRNMTECGVSEKYIRTYFKSLDISRVLPFRFITAARHAPQYEPELESLMFKSISGRSKLDGRTVVLVDVSGSMDSLISSKSEVTRIDVACGVAMLAREYCKNVSIYTFSESLFICPPRRGFSLRDSISNSQSHEGTRLGASVGYLNKNVKYDRLIVITDEQSQDQVPDPKSNGYMINVSTNKNGIGYGKWIHMDGWSESILEYISMAEDGAHQNL